MDEKIKRSSVKEFKDSPSYWWVNQGDSYTTAREDGYLWAPKLSRAGNPMPHHVRLLEANIGDVVFCYADLEIRSLAIVKEKAVPGNRPTDSADKWEKQGNLLQVEYIDFNSRINKDEIPLAWRKEEKGAFNKNGDLNQGYFFAVSPDFVGKVFNTFKERFPQEIHQKFVENKPGVEGDQVNEVKGDYYTKGQIVNHVDQYIAGKGFIYSKEEITNLYLSLKTKPFVILSGISGTGKTMVARWFAKSLGANEANGQLAMIPVRPDWSDGSDLLGYVDIKGDFQIGPLTDVILRALDYPDKPYFVLLDEMNLARVEYYFSDVLSVMESRSWYEDRIQSSILLTKEEAGVDVYLPDNLYIIGTVNMDETTHPFSKKVLDRANTIEFNHVDLTNLSFLGELDEIDPLSINQKELATQFLHLKDVFETHEQIVRKTSSALAEINQSLERMHLHVGYRVRDEISFYLAYNEEAGYFTFDEGFDFCVLQKVLPRISGSDSRVDQILRELYQLFTKKVYDETLSDYQNDLDFAKYPRSARKVLQMLRRLEDDGFTSFWIT